MILALYVRNNRIKSKGIRDREENAEKLWVDSDIRSATVSSGGANATNNSPKNGINIQENSENNRKMDGADLNETIATYLPYTDHEIDCEGLHSSNVNRKS